jgi:hypothetical protein
MKRLIPVAALACAIVLAAEATAAGSPLTGQFQTVISGKNSALNGTWVLSFAPNGFYTVAKKPRLNTVLVAGSSAISGKKLLLSDLQGRLACKAPAAYMFNLSGKTVRFKKLNDPCAGRLALLKASWTKIS